MERRFLLLPLMVAGAMACATVLGIEDRPLRPDTMSTDAAAEAASPDPCAHLRPAGPPDKDDAPDSLPPFYLAVRSLQFLGDKARQAGFDLDHVCTCDKRPAAAFDGGPSCKALSPDCDEDGGVDNRAAAFLADFADVLDFDQIASIGADADQGRRAMLLHVAEYNGTANDTDVRIGIMTSRGILDGSGCGTSVDAGGDATAKSPAGWCGRDRWSYSNALVVPQTKVPITRVKGWVRDGRLTFQSDASISLYIAESKVSLTTPIGVGKLEKGGDGLWRLGDAVLAGRMPTSDLLAAVGTSPSGKRPDGGRGQFCEQTAFTTIKATICQQPDIHIAGETDNTPTACDAVSTAVSFAAEQADIGDEFTPAPDEAPCAPDRVEAGLYACP